MLSVPIALTLPRGSVPLDAVKAVAADRAQLEATRPASAAAAQEATEQAKIALESGDHRLYWLLTLGGEYPAGVTCHGPLPNARDPWAAPLVRGTVFMSDVPGDPPRPGEVSRAFADQYNRVITASPDFRFRDICRPSRPDERHSNQGYHRFWAVPPTDAQVALVTLGDAARSGSLSRVNSLLAEGASVDQIDAFGMSPLGWALIRGHDRVAKVLLDAGARALFTKGTGLGMEVDYRRRPPLLYAVAFNRQSLLQRMATDDTLALIQSRSGDYISAAVYAGNARGLKRILNHRKEKLHPGESELLLRTALAGRKYQVAETIIHYTHPAPKADAIFRAAIQTGDLEYVRRSLAQGADPNGLIPYTDESALHFVAGRLSARTAPTLARRLIHAGAKPDRPNSRGLTPLQILVRQSSTLPQQRHLDPLFEPIRPEDRIELLGVLLSEGADINRVDGEGRPMLMQFLHVSQFNEKPSDFDSSWLPILVRAGMDLNARYRGRTGLQHAQAAGDSPLIRTLTDLGAR
jgi:ankyrin repeat protein